MKNLMLCIVGLAMLASTLTWHPIQSIEPIQQRQSVCTMTGLTGPALQEDDAYCDGVNIAPSTYPAAIAFAQARAIVIGTPERVYTCHDWHGVLRVCVDFSRGFQAQHYLAYNPAYHPVFIYDSCSNEVWPLWIISRPC